MAQLPQIAITASSVQIDQDEFRFAEVTSVGYLRVTTRASGVITNLVRRFEIDASGRRHRLNLDGVKVLATEREQIWRRLVGVCQEAIEPRLRSEALELLRAGGDTFSVGRLELDAAGFSWRGALRPKRFGWPEHRRTYFRSGQIKIVVGQADGRGREKTAIVLGTEVLNAVLLPKLMIACAGAFGSV